MLKVGDKAPALNIPDQNSKIRNLSDFSDKWLLLYFYPKDFTPGCTTEACTFRDNYSELSKISHIVGVSADSVDSHKKFEQNDECSMFLEQFENFKTSCLIFLSIIISANYL